MSQAFFIKMSRSYSVRHATFSRNPLEERSARRTGPYMTMHNTHKKETSMPSEGFEPAFTASEWQQNHALDHAAIGIDKTR